MNKGMHKELTYWRKNLFPFMLFTHLPNAGQKRENGGSRKTIERGGPCWLLGQPSFLRPLRFKNPVHAPPPLKSEILGWGNMKALILVPFLSASMNLLGCWRHTPPPLSTSGDIKIGRGIICPAKVYRQWMNGHITHSQYTHEGTRGGE